MRDEVEEARDRYLWGITQRALWSSLVLLVVGGVLCGVTVALAWDRFLLTCAVGLLAGGAVSIAASGSPRSREQTALVLGAVTLPLLAAQLAGAAAEGARSLDAYRAALVPFLVHAGGAFFAGAVVAHIWRGLPPRPQADPEDEHARGAVAAPTPTRGTPARAAGGGG